MNRDEIGSFRKSRKAVDREVKSLSISKVELDSAEAKRPIEAIDKVMAGVSEGDAKMVKVGFAKGVGPPELRILDCE